MIINIEDDFDLYKIANCGQCFRGIEVTDGVFRFITKENVIYMKADECDPVTGLVTKLDVSVSQNEWDNVWHFYFDMNRDYKSIRQSITDDEYLMKASELGKGIRILKQDYYEMLITFIISQRKSIPAIRTSIERMCKLHGKEIKTEYETLYAFPTAKELSDAEDLDSCGLGYRLPYIIDASRDIALGIVDLQKYDMYDDEELFEHLKLFKGVGDKVANCISLFGYGRTNRAPVDVWIKRVIDEEYNGINPFDKYEINAGIMQQYMFYAAKNR